MADVALRLETAGGMYTNVPGETSSVFDVTAVAVVFDPDNMEIGENDGRPTLASNRGASVSCREYARNTQLSPDNYLVERVDKGMYTDGPVRPDDAVLAVFDLLGLDAQTKVATFVGPEAVNACLNQLLSVGCSRAHYLFAMAILAINYAQREIPG
jgi:hypothetical protein